MIKDFTQKYKKIHFLGIGGRGLSSLAQILHLNDAQISGTDLNQSSNLELLPKCIKVFTEHTPQNIQDIKPDLVIHTYAIPDDNPELLEAKSQGIPTMTYPQAVGAITKGYKLLSIAGSHGKTTTTGMLIHVFQELGIPFNAIIGTTTKMLNNNNMHFDPKAEYFILESCEYREAFSNYTPHSAIITNIETDHFDFYKSDEQYTDAFNRFIQNIQENLILNIDYPLSKNLKTKETLNTAFYSQENNTKLVPQPGAHNQTNAQAALKLCTQLGLDTDKVKQALMSFPGVARRQELVLQTQDQKFFDDNAHTPTEVAATIQAFKEGYPQDKLCVIFQPQGYIRIVKELEDFIRSLKKADKIIIPNILASRDSKENIDKMPAEKFVQEIQKNHSNTVHSHSIEQTKANLKELTTSYPIVVLIGGHHDVRRIIE